MSSHRIIRASILAAIAAAPLFALPVAATTIDTTQAHKTAPASALAGRDQGSDRLVAGMDNVPADHTV